jgi:outer membrane protein assembly factor BamC
LVKPCKRLVFGLTAALNLAALGACNTVSEVLPDRRTDYKNTVTLEALEVPPDLTSSTIDDSLIVPELGPAGTATFSDYSRERQDGVTRIADLTLLEEPDNARIDKDGDRRWLVVEDSPDALWPQLQRFWDSNGFALVREDAGSGIMETEWAENRADIPDDPLRNILGKGLGFLYSAPTRDRYRTRIERGQFPGTTDVFITHYGMREVQRGQYDVIWEARPRDPELEAEMLNRFMVYLGISEERAQRLLAEREGKVGERAAMRTSADGDAYLQVDESLPKTWRLVGLSLDGSFVIQDSDQSRGVYTVRLPDPKGENENKGVLSGLAFWRNTPDDNTYLVTLRAEGREATNVSVNDESGETTTTGTARAILATLENDLK